MRIACVQKSCPSQNENKPEVSATGGDTARAPSFVFSFAPLIFGHKFTISHRFPRSKCHRMAKEVTIKDLSSQVLDRIVRRGEIDDIVSKERISRHFGTAVDHVLASKATISSPDTELIVELTKRMPRLRKFASGHLMTAYAEDLARNNQGITEFASSSHSYEKNFALAYIRCVKGTQSGVCGE